MQLFERQQGGDNGLLVNIHFSDYVSLNADQEELAALAEAAGLYPALTLTARRAVPEPKYFMGRGKVDEALALCDAHQLDVVVVNHPLSPAQERNLEQALGCKVIDRTRLILEIFSRRAQTREGRLQVELAQLDYQSTRLVKGWTHLERQQGGIGVRGGPGEKQLELDKRLIRERMTAIEKSLARVKKQRQQGRQYRKKNRVPTISVVGYTNAGKSTLFNQVAGAHVMVRDQLFATLDPTLRRVHVPRLGEVVFSDTVGFIKNLPHNLVDAFSATLEEAVEADLLLHVIDCSDAEYPQYMEQVDAVLERIGAADHPRIEVYNKTDRLKHLPPSHQQASADNNAQVWVSATRGDGIGALYEAIAAHFRKHWCCGELVLPPHAGRARAALYELGAVEAETCSDQGEYILTVQVARRELMALMEANHLELGRCFKGQ